MCHAELANPPVFAVGTLREKRRTALGRKLPMLDTVQTCPVLPCPATLDFQMGLWSPCSVTCGVGLQTRQVKKKCALLEHSDRDAGRHYMGHHYTDPVNTVGQTAARATTL